jgi:SET domain-containing protein
LVEDGFIDAKSFGNLLRYANHSNEANIDVKFCKKDGISQVMFSAKRKIKAEEEIFINYGKDFWKNS